VTVAAAVTYAMGAFLLGYCVGLFIQSLRKFSDHV
jgi:hypothetical protein